MVVEDQALTVSLLLQSCVAGVTSSVFKTVHFVHSVLRITGVIFDSFSLRDRQGKVDRRDFHNKFPFCPSRWEH